MGILFAKDMDLYSCCFLCYLFLAIKLCHWDHLWLYHLIMFLSCVPKRHSFWVLMVNHA